MKRHVKKLALSRDTLRNLDTAHLTEILGAATTRCTTGATDCERCYTGDVTDCPGCNFVTTTTIPTWPTGGSGVGCG